MLSTSTDSVNPELTAPVVPAPTGRRGRTLSELARRAHDSVVAVLGTEPLTRSRVLAALTDESERTYAHMNWQNLIARLMSEGRVRLAEGSKSQGRGVSYVRA